MGSWSEAVTTNNETLTEVTGRVGLAAAARRAGVRVRARRLSKEHFDCKKNETIQELLREEPVLHCHPAEV